MKISTYLKRIRAFIKSNFKQLIISLLLSIVIWFAISIQVFPNVYDHIYDIPVSVTQTPLMQEENLQIVDFEQKVNIQIMGKRYVIGTLSADDFIATANLTAVTAPGKYTVDIEVKPKNSNDEYEVVSKELQTVINVERIVTKTFNVEPDVSEISIVDGLQINQDEITCSPSFVTLTGEQSVINAINNVTVKAQYNGDLSVSTEVEGLLCLYKKDGTQISNTEIDAENDKFNISIPVWKVKTLPLNVSLSVPDNFDRTSLPFTVLPNEITIAAPANDTSIDNLDRMDIGEITLEDLTSKDLQGIRLTISLPTGYKNLSNVAIAQVNFDDAAGYGKLDFTIPTDNFSILNGDSSYDYSIVTSQIEVTVVGPSDVLKNLTVEDIKGTINLLGVSIEDGIKNVKTSMEIEGDDVTAWVSGNYKVDIKATKAE